jgi:hypothetical protein
MTGDQGESSLYNGQLHGPLLTLALILSHGPVSQENVIERVMRCLRLWEMWTSSIRALAL